MGWQHQLEMLLRDEPTRQVIWIVDKRGCSGRTWFSQWYWKFGGKPTSLIDSPDVTGLAEALIENDEVVIVDVTRDYWNRLDVEFFQEFADRAKEHYGLCVKYKKKAFKMPHVVVFSPLEPVIYNANHKKEYKIVHIDKTYLKNPPSYLFDSKADAKKHLAELRASNKKQWEKLLDESAARQAVQDAKDAIPKKRRIDDNDTLVVVMK